MIRSKDWADRAAELAADSHLRAQVERLMEPLRVIRGTRDAPTYDEVVSTASQLVALLELNPTLSQTANVGGLVAVRGSVEGYSLLLHATDIHVTHLSSYATASKHWRAGAEAASAARAAAESGTD